MYVRLAFAVAAHLDAEILVIDEVLAVGDARFQTKCMGKMQNIAGENMRTVLFVSHNMGAINKLCDSAILLDHGNIKSAGKAPDVVSHYLSSSSDGSDGVAILPKTHSEAYFTRIALLDGDDKCGASISVTSGFKIQLEYDVLDRIPELEVSFSLFDSNGSKVFHSGLSKSKPEYFVHDPGHYTAELNIPGNFIAPGRYNITIDLHQPNIRYLDRRHDVMKLSIVETGSDEYRYDGREVGSILVAFDWNVKKQ